MTKAENKVHCQICGREIKAAKGVIAHHGYQRPGGGWQTASCAGARYLPYEISSDRLPVIIAKVSEYLDRMRTEHKNWIANPPATLTVQVYRGLGPNKMVDTVKPEGFVAVEGGWGSIPDTYENGFYTIEHEQRRNIRATIADLNFMQARLEGWVAPSRTQVNAWMKLIGTKELKRKRKEQA